MTYQRFYVDARLYGLASTVRSAVLCCVPFDLISNYCARFVREGATA